MNHTIKILVADDHPMLLNGLRTELLAQNYKVLEGAQNGAQALEAILTEQPDIAILDIEMPIMTGFEVIAKCQEKEVATRFILLTSYKEKGFVLKAKKLNISGYLLKDEPFMEIERCIQAVFMGGFYFSEAFYDILKHDISPQLEKIKFLSPSELTILRYIAKDKSSNEIADVLNISPRTVQKHRSNIISKLGLSSESDVLSVWTQKNKDLLMNL